MAKKEPVTQAVRELRRHSVPFEGFPYDYVEGGGSAQFAARFRVAEHQVIKTLILEDERGRPLVALMHGDCQVSTKALARAIGVKAVRPCDPRVADRHSGYQVGGTSPFGTRARMPVYCQKTIAELPRVYINGGKRGYIMGMECGDLLRVLQPQLLEMRA